jgi:nucleotide-binding universal stress UspA family protein
MPAFRIPWISTPRGSIRFTGAIGILVVDGYHVRVETMHLLLLKIVLATVEMDEAAVPTLRAASALAAAAGAQLEVVHVARDANAHDSKGRLDEAVRSLLGSVGVEVHTTPIHVLSGDPAHSIRVLADKIRADVIVLGPHRQDIERGNRLGSTALAIVTASWAPCLIVTEPMRLPVERVVVPLDLSDTARGALLVGLSWASALRSQKGDGNTGVRLTTLYADQSSHEHGAPPVAQFEAELTRVRGDAGTWAGVAIEGPEIVPGDPATVIAAYAVEQSVDLIVMGTRGLGIDTTGRLGSVAGDVAKRVDTPLLLVPPAVWQTYSDRR